MRVGTAANRQPNFSGVG
jgi:intraflagellar transport protein 74